MSGLFYLYMPLTAPPQAPGLHQFKLTFRYQGFVLQTTCRIGRPGLALARFPTRMVQYELGRMRSCRSAGQRRPIGIHTTSWLPAGEGILLCEEQPDDLRDHPAACMNPPPEFLPMQRARHVVAPPVHVRIPGTRRHRRALVTLRGMEMTPSCVQLYPFLAGSARRMGCLLRALHPAADGEVMMDEMLESHGYIKTLPKYLGASSSE